MCGICGEKQVFGMVGRMVKTMHLSGVILSGVFCALGLLFFSNVVCILIAGVELGSLESILLMQHLGLSCLFWLISLYTFGKCIPTIGGLDPNQN